MSLRSLSWSLAAASLCLFAAGGAQAQMTILGSLNHVSCNGGSNGSASATVYGGTAPYSYTWYPGGHTGSAISGLSAGTYTLTVTDAIGTTQTHSWNITQPSALIATIASTTNVTSPGGSDGSATAYVSGGTGSYTYSWAPTGGTAATASGLSAGTYAVTVTDANMCQSTHSITIIEAVAAATIASVSVPASASYAAGDILTFTVSFSEAVTVDTSGGTPRIQLIVGTATRYANYSSGSGTSSLSFQHIVEAGDTDTDGITIGTLGLNGGTIRNGATNVDLTLNSVGSTAGVLVAASAPAPVPTLTEWAMMLLAGLLGLFGLSQVMQRRRAA